MNNFFLYWVDLVAMVGSLYLALVLTIQAKKRAGEKLRAGVTFFLFLAPAVISVHMFFHLAEILIRAVESAANGKFNYSFRLYSLLLMGGLTAYLGWQLLHDCRLVCMHRCFIKKRFFRTVCQIVLVTLPTVAFTPIGALPALACLISLVALPFLQKSGSRSKIGAVEEAVLY